MSKRKNTSAGRGCLMFLAVTVVTVFVCAVTLAVGSRTDPNRYDTNTPDGAARQAVYEAIGVKADNAEVMVFGDGAVTVRYAIDNLTPGMTRTTIDMDAPEIVCGLRARGATGPIVIHGTIEVVDTLGNTSRTDGATLRFDAQTVSALNCDGVARGLVSGLEIADFTGFHPALR